MNPFSDTHTLHGIALRLAVHMASRLYPEAEENLEKSVTCNLKKDICTAMILLVIQLVLAFSCIGITLVQVLNYRVGVIEPFCLKASEYGTYSRPLQPDPNTLPANATQSPETSANTSFRSRK